MKVTGIKREDGQKDFQIEFEGETYLAVRRGNRFECNGVVGTLKLIKQKIISKAFAEMPEEEVELEQTRTKGSTWDCVDPCAWLVLLPFAIDEDVRYTLDCHGYVKPDGELDYEFAKREVERWKRNRRRKHAESMEPNDEAMHAVPQ